MQPKDLVQRSMHQKKYLNQQRYKVKNVIAMDNQSNAMELGTMQL